ncbi:MAG: OsmC family protein [Chloroflexi bacterium]|nr:OsmC family protein [Chloroflexota bacterium]
MPGEEFKIDAVRSYTSTVVMRTLNTARDQHWIVDSSHGPGEAPGPVEVFLSGISSCGVHQVELIAEEQNVPLRSAICAIESTRKLESTNTFHSITLRFELEGPSEEQARALVNGYQSR